MKTRIVISLLLFMLLSGCTNKVMPEFAGNNENVSFPLKFQTYAADNGGTISTIRVVVVAKSDNQITCNRIYSGDGIRSAVAGSFSVSASARPGKSTIYVIANEPDASTATLDNMKLLSDLQAATIAFTPLASVNTTYDGGIPMVGQGDYDISPVPSMNNIEGIELERLLTKISMKFQAAADFVDKVIITGVQLGNAPKYSYLIANEYPETNFATTPIMPIAPMIIGTTQSAAIDFYAPEYIIADEAISSYVTVIGKRVSDNVTCLYTVPLGEKMVSETTDNTSNLIRNSHYDIQGTIKGYGQTDFDIKVSASPWNSVVGGSEAGKYITTNISTVKLIHTGVNSTLTVLSNDLNAVEMACDLTILESVVFDRTTGQVTIKAKYNYKITELTPRLTTIKFKLGRFKKEVVIALEPLVWATGDIARDDQTNQYVIGWTGHGHTLLFMFGSKIGLGYFNTPWTSSTIYYTPNANKTLTAASGLDISGIQAYARGASGLGDPCASVVGGPWRTPTMEEFQLLNKPEGIPMYNPQLSPNTYVFSAFKDAQGNNIVLPALNVLPKC